MRRYLLEQFATKPLYQSAQLFNKYATNSGGLFSYFSTFYESEESLKDEET